MRRPSRGPCIGLVIGALFATLSANAQEGRVAAALDRAHLALAGGTERTPPTTFVLKGQKVNGTAGVALAFEVYAQLPDQFVWREDVGTRGMTVRGSDRGSLITNMPQDRLGGISSARAEARDPTVASPTERAAASRDVDQLALIRAKFAALTLGIFAGTFSAAPLTFMEVSGGDAAMPLACQARTGLAQRWRLIVQPGFRRGLVIVRRRRRPTWLFAGGSTRTTGQWKAAKCLTSCRG